MAGMSLNQMNTLLSSQATLKNATDMNRNRNMMQGEMGVLASQIETDKCRGVNTKEKEDRLAEIEANTNNLMNKLGETTKELGEKMASDSERISEEDAAQQAAQSGKTATVDANSGEANAKTGDATASRPTDTVKISVYAHNVAVNAPSPIPEIQPAQPLHVGEIINAKA